MRHLYLNECMYEGIPKTENKCAKCFTTVAVETSVQGTAKSNIEYSSATLSRYLFCVFDGKGPLKCKFSLSNVKVALIKFPLCKPIHDVNIIEMLKRKHSMTGTLCIC